MAAAVILSIAALPARGADASARVRNFRNVILIGWDGARRERVRELLARGAMPNLGRLIARGKWVDTEVTTGATDTKAGWAQILTGYDPKITGVYDNRMRYGAIPEGYTLPERLKALFGEGITTIFLAGKKHNLGTRGPHRVCLNCGRDMAKDETAPHTEASGESLASAPAGAGPGHERSIWEDEALFDRSGVPKEKRQIREFDGEPYHLASKRVDVFENALGPMARVGPKVLEQLALNKDRRFFLFVEFEEPDEQGHVSGEGSKPYRDALLGLDAWLGRIQGRLKELGLAQQTLIYLVTDHGFREGGYGHMSPPQPKTFLVTDDPAVLRSSGDRKDVTPTILDRFGADLGRVTPPLNGSSLLRAL